MPDDIDSWLWCDDPAPGIDMLEDEAIKYVRADEVKDLEQANKELLEALISIEALLPVYASEGSTADKISKIARAAINKHKEN